MNKVLGIVLSLVVVLGVALGSQYFKYYNLGVTYERQVKTVHENNKVVLNSYTTKVQEVAQVPAIVL